MSFAPHFLNQAGYSTDKVERFKLVIAFAISSQYCSSKLTKPFNPILGETFQAFFPDGTKIFCEQTNHHPPIANFLMEDSESLYKVWGYFEFKAKISQNTLNMSMEGPNYVRF